MCDNVGARNRPGFYISFAATIVLIKFNSIAKVAVQIANVETSLNIKCDHAEKQ
jgi:hypothetical protein